MGFAIECAHVRTGTDGGLGLEPSDWWTISLSRAHRIEQHQIGERPCEAKYERYLHALAQEFASRSAYMRDIEGQYSDNLARAAAI